MRLSTRLRWCVHIPVFLLEAFDDDMEYLDAYILRLKHLLRFRILNEDRKTTGLLTTGHRTTGLQEKSTSIN